MSAAGLDLRLGEALGLRVNDVDFLRQHVSYTNRLRIVGGELILAPQKVRKEWEVSFAEVVAVAISERLRQ